MLDKYEDDDKHTSDNQKAQVECKPLVNTIAQKTVELSKVWEKYFDLVQLVKLDCGRSEGEYFYWLYELQGTLTEVVPSSWTYLKNLLEDKKARLDKCKPV